MRLVGNPRGMKLYPSMLKEVTACKHKYGADVTVSYHTDTYKPNLAGHGIDAEINSFKHNLQGTIMINKSTDSAFEKEIKEALVTGRLSSGLYFRAMQTDYATQYRWHEEVTGKLASYWSYGNGLRDYDDLALARTLVTRLSSRGQTSYDFDDRLGHSTSTLFNYDVRDFGIATALSNAETLLNQAIAEGGWYNDFSHWHWAEQYGDKDQLEQFLSQQRALLNSVNSVSLGAGEAVEYMWLRKQFKRGGIYQDGDELVLICDVRNENDLPYNAISQTLSVELDVSGTILANKEVSATSDILKVSANNFIVQVPYDKKDGFRAVRLKVTSEPTYLDLGLPSIVSNEVAGGQIVITADKDTKAVLFKVPTAGRLYQAEVVERSQYFSTDHGFTETSGHDLYVGLITMSGQSSLTQI